MAVLLSMTGAALAQPAGGSGRSGKRQGVRGGYADPSLIVAAELAFDRLAVEKGQWTALARIVADDALLFQPGPVFAKRWLKGRRNPAIPLRWQTRQVFMACDGSAAVSTGLWTRGADADGGGEQGRFTNIWRRDKGGYRLILSHDGPQATAAPSSPRGEDELEAMTARIATCPRRGPVRGEAAEPARAVAVPLDPRQPLPTSREDRSEDGTLRWRWSVAPGGAPVVQAWMATGESGDDSRGDGRSEALLPIDQTARVTR